MSSTATKTPSSAHTAPEWFHDAKLGVFIHWGPYSVPAWAPVEGDILTLVKQHGHRYSFAHNPYAEWYANSLRIPGSPAQRHHAATFGADFPYTAFGQRFNTAVERFDPNAWAQLFAQAGARYVVLVTKHHDGFTLWPSRRVNPYHPGFAAKRDLVGEVTAAVRARGLRMGLYYSGGLDWTFDDTPITDYAHLLFGTPAGPVYAAYADAHLRELIERYAPSILWNDIGYPAGSDLKRLFAEYYAAVPDGAINDRFGQRRRPPTQLWRTVVAFGINALMSRRGDPPAPDAYDFRTPEYTSYSTIQSAKWEATRGLGYSFGYNQLETDEQLLSASALVTSFIDIVSKNGNLLLNIGPMADGAIPEGQAQRLRELGAWLAVHGEGIYATRPWRIAEGSASEGVPLRFTSRPDSLYAFLLETPRTTQVTLTGLVAEAATEIHLLGEAAPLDWQQRNEGIQVTLPQPLPSSLAHTLRISPQPILKADGAPS